MTTGLAHPAIKGLLDAKLSKLPPDVQALVKENLEKAQERARSDAATPATLAELSTRITRSDARAATALDEANQCKAEVVKLRAIVLEMTAKMDENTALLNRVMTELGIKH